MKHVAVVVLLKKIITIITIMGPRPNWRADDGDDGHPRPSCDKNNYIKLLYFILNISKYCDHFIIVYLYNTISCIHIPIIKPYI